MPISEALLFRVFRCTLDDFFRTETAAVLEGVNERNHCGRMAIYMQSRSNEFGLTNYFADVEYNRKQNGQVKTILSDGLEIIRINCDLILHSRGRFGEDNLIAVELKKAERPKKEKQKDRNRLRALTKSSDDHIWSADGITRPGHVCGYRLGTYVELDRHERRCLIEYYRGGEKFDEEVREF